MEVSYYFSKLIIMVNQMKAYVDVVTDQQMVEKIMRSMSSNFDYAVLVIQELKDVRTMKIEEIVSSLETYELFAIERESKRSVQQAWQA